MKVKPCPVCGIGTPRMVHFALPLKYFPDQWEETEDCLFEPVATYKYIECDNCGARTINTHISCNDAINEWNYVNPDNERIGIIQYICDENMEVDGNAKT